MTFDERVMFHENKKIFGRFKNADLETYLPKIQPEQFTPELYTILEQVHEGNAIWEKYKINIPEHIKSDAFVMD